MKTVHSRIALILLMLVTLAGCGGSKRSTVVPTQPQIRVSITTDGAAIDQGATKQFTAAVTGTTNTLVNWSISEGAGGGIIDAQGMYTAPSNSGTFHIVATSAADPTQQAIVAVNVNFVTLQISPGYGDMEPGVSYQFSGSVTGSVNREIIWTVSEGAVGGTVTASGMYTAPMNEGVYHLVATSTANPFTIVTTHISVSHMAVAIQPRGIGIAPGEARSFTATVLGCMDDAVTWSVQEGMAGGSISSDGVYTPPMSAGTYHILATSVSHPNLSGVAIVTVRESDFRVTGSMLDQRIGHTATLLPNGDVLFAGGGSVNYGYWYSVETVELYDHLSGTFKYTGSMSAVRDGHTATLLKNGKVLIAGGGIAGWVGTNTAELYDPANGQFTLTGSMNAYRTYHTATLLNDGRVLITGGNDGWASDRPNIGDVAKGELYDPTTGVFTLTGQMVEARFSHAAELLPDGKVLLVAGSIDYGGAATDSEEVFDPETGTFTKVGNAAEKGFGMTATLVQGNQVLIAGGRTYDGADFSLRIFDKAQLLGTTSWSESSLLTMNSSRSSHTATRLPSGKVLLAGGYATAGAYGMGPYADNSADLFDPSTSTFVPIGQMQRVRAEHTATLLQDGSVLIAGGDDTSAELYTAEVKK
jgi:hypothetical protein